MQMTKKLPLTYFGKVVGTATIDSRGTLQGELDLTMLSKEEQQRLLGDIYVGLNVSISNEGVSNASS